VNDILKGMLTIYQQLKW